MQQAGNSYLSRQQTGSSWWQKHESYVLGGGLLGSRPFLRPTITYHPLLPSSLNQDLQKRAFDWPSGFVNSFSGIATPIDLHMICGRIK